ncbi:transcription termination factor Rho [Nocardia heshunensis]
MRKGDLIAAIKENQGGGSAGAKPATGKATRNAKAKAEDAPTGGESVSVKAAEPAPAPAEVKAEAPANRAEQAEARQNASETRESKREEGENARAEGGESESGQDGRDGGQRGRGRQRRGREQRGANAENTTAEAPAADKGEQEGGERRRDRGNQGERNNQRNDQGERNNNQGERNNQRNDQGERNSNGGQQNGAGRNNRDNRDNRVEDDEEGGRGRRGRRFRERRRGRDREGVATGGGEAREMEIREDDVLQPVAGILDVLDNYAFVRTSGYLAGQNDVYVSMNLVRKNGLRRGDAITGAVRAPRDGDQSNQRQKFDPLVRLDTVNGGDVESAKRRPEFNKLTPLYPNQRLRLETQPNKLTTRIIDLIMPIGKGQRALIVSPPKAGKTMVIQDIANAIATNNPECYLMVVLVDERPEEVTDMQRSVRGEVIASTFDRPPSDHTSVAELAIERAKRLVEAGQDVVVLLDSITRLGRAYNNSSPASGRILSGGVDSTALYPPKRFLGAARNIENGGSLTIIATALVETGSTGDTVIFEEFKGTGNAELKLDRKIAERRVFPAVDVNLSSTRRDDLLMSPDEAAVLHKLRRVLSGLDSHQAIDLMVDRLKKTKSNIEFLMTVSKTAPGAIDE